MECKMILKCSSCNLNAQAALSHFSLTFLYYMNPLSHIQSLLVQQLPSQFQENSWQITAQIAHTTWWWAWQQSVTSFYTFTPSSQNDRLFCLCLWRSVAGCSLHILRMSVSHPSMKCIWSWKSSYSALWKEGYWESFILQIHIWYFIC